LILFLPATLYKSIQFQSRTALVYKTDTCPCFEKHEHSWIAPQRPLGFGCVLILPGVRSGSTQVISRGGRVGMACGVSLGICPGRVGDCRRVELAGGVFSLKGGAVILSPGASYVSFHQGAHHKPKNDSRGATGVSRQWDLHRLHKACTRMIAALPSEDLAA